MRLRPTLAFALILSVQSIRAEDWPQWRGPRRDGISRETGLLKVWPSGGPRVLWKASGLGSGYSSVAVAAGKIFTSGDTGGASRVLAFDLNGKPLWAVSAGQPGAVGWGDFEGPRSTPTADGDLVFNLTQWGDLVCVESKSGHEVWRKSFEKDFGASRPEWGFSESPLVDGQHLLCTPGGSRGALVALDKTTGAVLWRTADLTDIAAYSSLIPATINGVRQFVQLTDAHVVGVSPEGKILWSAKRRGATAVIPTPVVRDNFVYVTSGYGIGSHLFQITGQGPFSAEQVYASPAMVNHHGGVVLLGNSIYGYSDGKGWACQDFKTGQMKWSDKEKMGKGSIVAVDGRLILRAEEGKGTVALIEASESGYREISRFDPPNRSDKNSWPHPVVAGGRLYLRDQDTLTCFDLSAAP